MSSYQRNRSIEIRKSKLAQLNHRMTATTLAAGTMPTSSSSSDSAPTPGKLRLVLISNCLIPGPDSQPCLSSAQLSDLRIFTSARVVYALTAKQVAGAVAQTHVYDYRQKEGRESHFGAPLSSVEVKLVDAGVFKTEEDGKVEGELHVEGPAVVDGKAKLGVIGTVGEDHTLSLI